MPNPGTTELVTIVDLSKPEGQRTLIRPLQPDELAQRERDRAEDARQQVEFRRAVRNGLLTASDWTQLGDAPLTSAQRSAWATYRQKLRDHPLDDTPWPDPPKP